MMNNNIAILITCFNRKDKTLNCLKALYDCQLPEYCTIDVFLVDDGCTDGTGKEVSEQFPQVNVIKGSGNLFWNRGMHLAWITATTQHDYDFYMWLNDDTTLNPETLQKLLLYSDTENHQSIICGATCATNDQNKITYGGWLLKETLIIPNGQIQPCDYFNGNIVLIPRHVFSVVGANDPVFSHAVGDFDYGLRARKLGVSAVVAPEVLGVCDEHETLAAWCNPKTPVLKRLKTLYTPLGCHPWQHFIFEKRHYGLLPSCFHFFTVHLRALIPALWKK